MQDNAIDFKTLVATHQRDDNYINATKWCSAFGKRWGEFVKLPTTIDYLKALADRGYDNDGKSRFIESGKGRGVQTYVHPLVAIALAKWLSPEFHVYVNETFQRFLENDITLADEILQKSTKEQAEWLLKRAEGKVVRSEFAAECVRRGCNGIGVGINTNAIYKGLFGMDASELKEALETKNPRDKMSKVELIATSLAEALAVEEMREQSARGNNKTSACSRLAGKKVSRVFE